MTRFPDISKIRQSFKIRVREVSYTRDVYPLAALILSISLAIIAGRIFLQSDGYIYLGEQFEVYNLDQFQYVVYPLWNEKIQSFSLADLTKLYVVIPVIGLAKAINAVTGIDGYKILQAILLLSPFSISFLSAFKLTQYVASKFSSDSFLQFLSAILAAFVFTVNPWFATNPRDYMFRLEYAILPLLLYLFLKVIYSRERKYIVFLALALSIIPTYRSLLLTSIMFLAILILDITISGRGRILYKISSVGTVVGLVFLLTAAKFLPSFLYSSSIQPLAAAQFNLNLLARENIIEILSTKFLQRLGGGFEVTYYDNFHLLFIAVTMFGFLYPFFLYRSRNVSKEHAVLLSLPIILYIAFFLLSARGFNLDRLLINEVNPFSEELGRLLRHAQWNIMPALVGLAIMIALSSVKIFSKLKRTYIYVLVSSFLLITSSISAWPIFSGDMNGYWRPAVPPSDYRELNQILKERGGDLHHIVWLPQYNGEHRTVWSNAKDHNEDISQSIAPSGIFPIRSSSIPSNAPWQNYFFDYYNPVRSIPGLNPMPIYTGNITKAYSPLNIHYLAIAHDGAWSKYRQSLGLTNEYLENTADTFGKKESATTLLNGSYLTGFELHNDAEQLYSARPILVLDRLSTYGELLPFINKDSGMIFGTSEEAIERGAEVSDVIVLGHSMDLLPLEKNKIVPEPAKFTNLVDPANTWSLANPHNLDLQDQLYENRLSWSWPFDYGYGLAYTSEPNAILKLQANIPKTDDYQIFLRYLKSDAGGSFDINIDGKIITLNTSRDYGSKFEWVNLGSYGISNGKKEITLKNLSGLNLVNVMMLIPANTQTIYDSLKTAVDSKELIYFYEAEHDFDEREKKSGTLSIRNSDAGLQFLEPATIALKLNILKEADYSLTLKGKGNFSLSIADNNGYNRHVEHLQSEALNYTWSNSSVHLTPGEYELLISSTGGSYLDQVMLHTSNRPIHQLLDSDPLGRVISYDKISPTSYEVKVKSDAPFLLAFAEGYDRFWIAKAKSSDNSRQFNSVPLYGLINGFWIDQTGEFSLIIEYQPQEWFNISAVISATSFVGVILYLAHPHLKLRQLFTILRYQQRRSSSVSK